MSETRTSASEGMPRRAILSASAATAAGVLAATAVSPQASAEGPRGSDKIPSQNGHTFSLEELTQLVGVLRKHEARFLDWCQYGQPAVDGVCGSVVVKPPLVGNVLSDLLKLNAINRWHVGVFPRGIPVLDDVLVRLEGGRIG